MPTPTETPDQEIATPDESTDLDALAASVTKEIENEFRSDPEFDEVDSQVADAADTHDPEQEVEAEGEGDEVEDKRFARGLERLSSREAAVMNREKAMEEREKLLATREAEAKRFDGLKPTAELKEQIEYDPSGVVEALGGDPNVVIKLLLHKQLGDKAPNELKEFARDFNTKREIAGLKRQLAQKERAESQQSYFNTIALGAREYVKDPGLASKMPNLVALNKEAPDMVHNDILEEIVKDARGRAQQDANGEPMTYEKAASIVEARLAAYRKAFTPSPGTDGVNASQKPATKAPPPTKPAPKPLRPWERKQDDLGEVGIREALRTFHQEEAKRKAMSR